MGEDRRMEGEQVIISTDKWKMKALAELFEDDNPRYYDMANYQCNSPTTIIERMEQELSDWLCDWDQ